MSTATKLIERVLAGESPRKVLSEAGPALIKSNAGIKDLMKWANQFYSISSGDIGVYKMQDAKFIDAVKKKLSDKQVPDDMISKVIQNIKDYAK